MWDPDDLLLREQAVLECYFSLMGQCSYDKAKETVERERDGPCKTHPNYVFSSVLTALSQLAVAEKLYVSLQYFLPKSFLRKDSSLKSMYEALSIEFKRLEERVVSCPTPLSCSPTVTGTSPMLTSSPSTLSLISVTSSVCSGSSQSTISLGPRSPSAVLDTLASHLCGQLFSLVFARLRTMDFYEQLYNCSSIKFIKFKDLSAKLNEIITFHQKLFHHPLLAPLKSAFSLECEILYQLLEAQVSLQEWNFLQSLLHLQEAHSKLGEWAASIAPKEKSLLSSTVRKPERLPPLYNWLYKFKAMLVAKFTLYFHKILHKQTTTQEMKSLGSRMTVDYCQKVAAFCKRSDAICVALLFHALGVKTYFEQGYKHPDRQSEEPKGIDSYPAVYCYPVTLQDKQPLSHWPNVIMIINDKSRELSGEGIVCFYDKRVETTYFLTKIDPRMTLVAIYGTRKSERDTFIVPSLQEFASHLRCNKVFAALKPGNK